MYPETPGFQHGSETSEAAANQRSIYAYRRVAHSFLKLQGASGATAKELARYMSGLYKRDIQYTTAGARLTELKRSGQAVESGREREGSDVIILREFLPPPNFSEKLREHREKLERNGHGHVVPRRDGNRERCGGPGLCKICRMEKQFLENLERQGA